MAEEIPLSKLEEMIKKAVEDKVKGLEDEIKSLKGQMGDICKLFPELCKKVEGIESKITVDFNTEELIKHLETCPTCGPAVLNWARKKLEAEKKEKEEERHEQKPKEWSPSQI